MKEDVQGVCVICGAKIIKKRDWKKYCSLKCRQVGYALKLLQEVGYTISK